MSEDHVEVEFCTVPRDRFLVDVRVGNASGVGERRAFKPLHHQDPIGAELGIRSRDADGFVVGERAAKLLDVPALTIEVEFATQRPLKLGDRGTRSVRR